MVCALGRGGWFALIQKMYNLEFQLPYLHLPVRSEAPSVRAVAAVLPRARHFQRALFDLERLRNRYDTPAD
jgi:hypothetical protein